MEAGMTYEEIRAFVGTWGLVYFVLLFLGVLVYALRPGAKRKFDEAARIPFKED